MDTILSVQNRNFAGDGVKFSKVSWTVTEAKSNLYEHVIGIWQIQWRKYHGIIEHLHLIDQKQMRLQNELYDE